MTRIAHIGAIGLVLATAFFILAVPAESAYWVTDLQISYEDQAVVATLQASADVSYSYFTMEEDEARLVVDLSDAVHGLPRYRYAIEGYERIRRIRTSQYRPYPQPSVRIVVDMAELVPFQVSTVDNQLIIALEDTPGAQSAPAQPAAESKEMVADQAEEHQTSLEQRDSPGAKPQTESSAESGDKAEALPTPEVSKAADVKPKASEEESSPAERKVMVASSTVQDSVLPTKGDSTLETQTVPLVARPFALGIREPVSYSGGGRRDPFAPLPAGQEVEFGQAPLADVEKLSIVGILWDVDGYRALAQDEDRNAYVFRKNDPVLYGYVTRIEEERVIFRLNRRGLDRTIILKLPQ